MPPRTLPPRPIRPLPRRNTALRLDRKRCTTSAGTRDGSAQVIDVREQHEWDAGHIAGAVHIPLAELPERLDDLPDEDLGSLVAMLRGERPWDAVPPPRPERCRAPVPDLCPSPPAWLVRRVAGRGRRLPAKGRRRPSPQRCRDSSDGSGGDTSDRNRSQRNTGWTWSCCQQVADRGHASGIRVMLPEDTQWMPGDSVKP